METIKAIVNNLSIPEKKRAIDERTALTSKIKFAMSQLSLNNMVALYAHNLEAIRYEQDEITVKNARLANVMLLHQEQAVQQYQSLRDALKKLDYEVYDYYMAILADLREELLDQNLPDIYVYQGLLDANKLKLCKHIIIPGRVQTYEDESEVGTVIYPVKEMESNRKLRHFYNNVSFRYLEGLSQDFSYDLEGKNLGRVLIK